MSPGDRVVVMSGEHRLKEGDLVGYDNAGRCRVWFPIENQTRTFNSDQLGELTRRRRDARPR